MDFLASAGAAVVLSILGLLVAPLPRSLEMRLGALLGRLAMRLDPKRREIARENMRRCLPDADHAALLRANYEHYGRLGLEMLHMFTPIPGHYRRYAEKHVRFHGLEHYEKATKGGRGAVLVTGHFANWELGGLFGTKARMLMATQRLKPRWFNDKMVAMRESLADEGRTVYGKRILPEILKHLRQGGGAGFMLDQYHNPPMGVPAKFFGATVATQGVVSLLVSRTGAAVVPARQERDEDGLIHFTVYPEIELSEAELADASATATKLAAEIERLIRMEPTQWLWAHRRFKNAVWPS